MTVEIKLAPPPPSVDLKASVHEAAKRGGRRLNSWGARNVSPNTVVSEDHAILRNRSYTSSRDNPWISRASTIGTANEIGTGIVPLPTTNDKDFNNSMVDLWKDCQYYMDYSGSLSIYGIQAAAARARREGGDVFVLIKRLRADRSQHLPLPLQFQVIDSTFCPSDFHRQHLPNGNRIVTGIEINKASKPVAYWFYKRDPREGHTQLSNLMRVPARDVIHHFKPTQPNQLRAVPEHTQGIVKAYTFEGYNDAELERKQERAHFTGTIERPDYGDEDYAYDPISGEPIETDHADVPMLNLEPGTFPNLLPGEKINVFNGDDAGRGYADYQRWQLLGVSAGVDIPYQLISGDFSEINDRLWRAIFNEFKREIMQVQNLYIIPQLCRIIWQEVVDRAIVSGVVAPPVGLSSKFAMYRCKHRPQAWEYIQPVQDIEADIKKVNAGFASRSGIVSERGDDETAEDVDNQRKLDKDREEELGLGIEDGIQPVETD